MSCDKFEKLFIQETENELLKHIQTCESCMFEYNKMLKTQSLIKEVKPVILSRKRNITLKRVAASVALVAITSTILFNSLYPPKLAYEERVSTLFPVDEYGLLDIQ